jgi:hypothetical protein
MMYVDFAEQAQDWGEWVFGDLAAAVCRVVEVVGPSARVLAISVSRSGAGVPRVRLLVTDADEAARLRQEADSGEYAVRIVGRPQHVAWAAEVQGVCLLVSVAGDES